MGDQRPTGSGGEVGGAGRESAQRGWVRSLSKGLALLHGRGRVVVLGEAAMLTAQRDGRGTRFGMNAGRNDNRNFTLNTLRWLVESAANTHAPGAGPAGAR